MNVENQTYCSVSKEEVENHFSNILGHANNMTSISIVSSSDDSDASDIIKITNKDMNIALSKIKLDTAPGPDRVTVHVLKHLRAGNFIVLLESAIGNASFRSCTYRSSESENNSDS